MGKQPVRLKAVVYSLYPFQQKTMSGLWNDLPGKIHHKISENLIGASLFLGPLIGTYSYVQLAIRKRRSWSTGIEHATSHLQ